MRLLVSCAVVFFMTISCNDSEFASEQKQTRKKVVKPTADAEPEQEKPTLTDQDIPPLGEEGNQVTIDPPKVAIEEGDQEPALAEPEIEQVDMNMIKKKAHARIQTQINCCLDHFLLIRAETCSLKKHTG